MRNSMLARRLRAIRKGKRLTQAQVAVRAGIAPSTYNDYENARVEPNIVSLSKVAEVLGTSVEYLTNHTRRTYAEREQIACRIRERRAKLHIYQKQMARKLGIPPSTYKYYETVYCDVSDEMIARIAEVLQTTPEYLLGTEPKESKAEPKWVIDLDAKPEPEPVREYNDSWADMDVGIAYDLANVADWSY